MEYSPFEKALLAIGKQHARGRIETEQVTIGCKTLVQKSFGWFSKSAEFDKATFYGRLEKLTGMNGDFSSLKDQIERQFYTRPEATVSYDGRQCLTVMFDQSRGQYTLLKTKTPKIESDHAKSSIAYQ